MVVSAKINHLVGMLIERKTKEIILKYPWPGCFKSVINGKKIEKKYWNTKKYFRMFDLGSKINNSLYINGRTDDVLNVRGHRIGSEEIESILLKIKDRSGDQNCWIGKRIRICTLNCLITIRSILHK